MALNEKLPAFSFTLAGTPIRSRNLSIALIHSIVNLNRSCNRKLDRSIDRKALTSSSAPVRLLSSVATVRLLRWIIIVVFVIVAFFHSSFKRSFHYSTLFPLLPYSLFPRLAAQKVRSDIDAFAAAFLDSIVHFDGKHQVGATHVVFTVCLC
jgi:hypothetical protein